MAKVVLYYSDSTESPSLFLPFGNYKCFYICPEEELKFPKRKRFSERRVTTIFNGKFSKYASNKRVRKYE